jgi:hypothetical protein
MPKPRDDGKPKADLTSGAKEKALARLQGPLMHRDSLPTKPAGKNSGRNFFVPDSDGEFKFDLVTFGTKKAVIIHQDSADETCAKTAAPASSEHSACHLRGMLQPHWIAGPGGSLWDCGVLLSRLLANPTITPIPMDRWKRTTVLELGCGVGLTGLVAAALGARCGAKNALADWAPASKFAAECSYEWWCSPAGRSC